MTKAVKSSMSLQAGAALAVITPNVPGPMDGIPRLEPSCGVHDDLFAKALVLENEGCKVGMVFLDLIGLCVEDVKRARRSASERTGIPPENILISCTHNHSGPATLGLFGDQDRDYLTHLPDRIAEALTLAQQRLTEARLGVGTVRVPGLAFNRRLILKDGSIRNNWERVSPQQVLRTEDVADEEAVVVKIDRADGRCVAVIVNFGLHVCVLAGDNLLISADFPAVMAETVRKGFHDSKPMVIFAQGCSGDVNHIDGLGGASPVQGFAGVEKIGHALGARVLQTLPSIPTEAGAPIASASKPLRLPWRQPYTPHDLDQARQLLSQTKAPRGLEHGIDPRIEARELLWLAEQPEKATSIELQTIRLGKLGLVALPLEPFAQFGRQIKADSPFQATMVVTCSNGSEGYIPSEEALASAQAYESKYLRWNKFGASAGRVLVRESLELLWALFPTG